MLIEKQEGLDQQTKTIKFLPVISQSIDRVVARVPSKSNIRNINKQEVKQKASKLIQIFESLTEEEIAILKSKLKILANKLIDKYAPPRIKNSPEIRQIINSSINLMNALGDEKLYKDFINIIAKIAKSAIQNPPAFEGANLSTVFQITGTEQEAKNLIRNYTQHLNKLAGEGERNNLSTEREESIIQRLTENNSNPQPNQEDTSLENILKDNFFTQGLNSNVNQIGNLTEQDL
ncbi:6286_t:CDS:2 [Funneliformis geosporum]|uniref:6286_t:CDS:1 n=1 Tax=Funneliformis geosporum TaxID=1117311 RepID=A0A9W4WQ51_9GLOM|nr:6286_t:CDS:2 [Funneliformis geosporum]